MSQLPLPRSAIPTSRVRAANERPARVDGDFVLYWMTAFRRTRYNFALQRAVEWANQLGKPLLILEALRVDYPWSSDRFHRFILEGMADNRADCIAAGVTYHAYLEPSAGAGKGLLAAIAARSCIVVTDDYPAFFLPEALRAAAKQVAVAVEAVDSNGLHALAAPARAFDTAFSFRRWLQQNILEDLSARPAAEPLRAAPRSHASLPTDIRSRWPLADLERGADSVVALLPVDHSVAATSLRGGSRAAAERVETFMSDGLARYGGHLDDVVLTATSGLSPYLHFGHLSAHAVFDAVSQREGWSIERAGGERRGKRFGFWDMSAWSEAFLDQLVTWRELGFNFCAYRADYDQFESLPDWARTTLERHERDPRPHLYSIEELEQAKTSDAVWNAAQVQLVREGVIHNYLRMLWGKRILEWTASPREALEIMVHLNNKYALDGRDPNSYSGIFWTLGRYDRPWGPERPIFGTVRYMSSANTRRKLKLSKYLARYGQEDAA